MTYCAIFKSGYLTVAKHYVHVPSEPLFLLLSDIFFQLNLITISHCSIKTRIFSQSQRELGTMVRALKRNGLQFLTGWSWLWEIQLMSRNWV